MLARIRNNKDSIIKYVLMTLGFMILNSIGFAILVMLFLDSPTTANLITVLKDLGLSEDGIKSVMELVGNESLFSDLDLKIKAGLIAGEVVALLITISLAKILYPEMRADRRIKDDSRNSTRREDKYL